MKSYNRNKRRITKAKTKKIGGASMNSVMDFSKLPSDSTIALNPYSPDIERSPYVENSRNITGGKRKIRKTKKLRKMRKLRKMLKRGGGIFTSSPLVEDPLIGSRYNNSLPMAFGSTMGGTYIKNELTGEGNLGGPKMTYDVNGPSKIIV